MVPPEFTFETHEVKQCPLCDSPERRDVIRVPGVYEYEARFVQCPACSLVYMDPAPTAKSLNSFYTTVYTDPEFRKVDGHQFADPRQELGAALPVAEQHFDDIEEHLLPPGRMLDVGCAYGAMLLEAAARGWHVHGIELSADAVQFCTKSLGLPVQQVGIMEAELPVGVFNAVVMLELIEHVPDPMAVMRRVAELSAPGALLYMSCPNAESPAARLVGAGWVGWKVPTHLQFFGFNSMRRLLSHTGWEPIRVTSGGGYPGQIRAIARRLG